MTKNQPLTKQQIDNMTEAQIDELSFTYWPHGLECPIGAFKRQDGTWGVNREFPGTRNFITIYSDYTNVDKVKKFLKLMTKYEIRVSEDYNFIEATY